MAITGVDTVADTTGSKAAYIDELFWIKTVQTPFYDIAKRGKTPSGATYYWNYISQTVPSATAAVEEGSTLTHDTQETENQFTQYVETNARTWRVTSLMQALAKAGGRIGRTDEMDEKEMENMARLKANCEWSFLNGAGGAGDGSGTPYYMKGLLVIAASGVTKNITSSTFGSTTGEDGMETQLDAVDLAGGLDGVKNMMYVTYANIRNIRKWTGIATAVNTMSPDMKVYSNVKVWDSIHGPIQIMGHKLMSSTKVLNLDADKVFVDVVEPTSVGENAIGKLFREDAASNSMSIHYGPVASLGLVTLT